VNEVLPYLLIEDFIHINHLGISDESYTNLLLNADFSLMGYKVQAVWERVCVKNG
jgi:hypothetical protein